MGAIMGQAMPFKISQWNFVRRLSNIAWWAL
jgi:hypothetical protein